MALVIILPVSALMIAVLSSNTVVSILTQEQLEQHYWREHDNTRLGLDDIESIVDTATSRQIASRAVDDTQASQLDYEYLLSAIIYRVMQMDMEVHWYLYSETIADYVEYQFELIQEDARAREIYQDNLGLLIQGNTRVQLSRSSNIFGTVQLNNLYKELLSVGVVSIMAYAIVGSVGVVQQVSVESRSMSLSVDGWIMDDIAGLLVLGAAAMALAAMGMMSDWSKIWSSADSITKPVSGAGSGSSTVVDEALDDLVQQIEQGKVVEYDKAYYTTKTLDIDTRRSINRSEYYIVLGNNGINLIIGIVFQKAIGVGWITEARAKSIMQMREGKFLIGSVVVSVYTDNPDKARNIAQVAGNNWSPVHHYSQEHGVKPGYFAHYHNGYMMSKVSRDTSLPHAFYGIPYDIDVTKDTIERVGGAV
jgi:hypothetical protein